MDQKLQNKLMDKYPKIFIQKELPMTKTAMCWGISCGDGWYDLIDELCENIQNHVQNKNRNNYNIPRIFYFSTVSDSQGVRTSQ